MGKPAGLATKQLRALDRLRRVQALSGFYLAGGTAVAFHLGHRRSLDLDLFSLKGDADLLAVQRSLTRLRGSVEVLGVTEATVKLKFLGESLDVVRYPYAPLETPQPGPSGFPIAGLLDLAVMKLAAIARRGIRRDFWDLYAITRAGVPLARAGNAYLQRYGVRESDLYFVVRSLTYFDDAEKDPVLPEGLTRARWTTIRRFFATEAPKLLHP